MFASRTDHDGAQKNCCPFKGIAANLFSSLVTHLLSLRNPRFKQSIPIDDYVLDVLMRDLIGHDQKPAAYLVYLHLYGQAARNKWRHISASVRMIADATGLSKSAVHAALTHLRRRQLITTTADHVTATPRHQVLRHWRTR
jgi:IclR-like helix-turn-helix domain-containing protein